MAVVAMGSQEVELTQSFIASFVPVDFVQKVSVIVISL